MYRRLLILFIIVPLVELYLLAIVGSRVGLPATILLVVLTGAWGAYLAKSQGLSILAKIQFETSAGRVPTAELLDGLLVLIGGVVLLTPGLLTDLVGFLLMVPSFRAIIRNRVKAKFAAQIRGFNMKSSDRMGAQPSEDKINKNDDIIDV
ncbi:MAG: membrane protein FxsA [Verrucomicrobiales bacterium]|nr:membrane protein FxsA [Verrucomicrobiales bacterium]|tara:strand:+ start:1379 stop:1828 length:450 start_codon:yes stop_codon:yes gene_type:complete